MIISESSPETLPISYNESCQRSCVEWHNPIFSMLFSLPNSSTSD